MTNYNQTLDWMFSRLPMYQRQGAAAYKKDLSNTLALLTHLKQPQENFLSVHIAGTNGKGSTAHMLASILQTAGYKVGLYTSPHLKDFRDRIKINGKSVTKQYVSSFVRENRSFFESNFLSFFEMTVGMAFNYFSKNKVDIAVVEVGMGGRLDSTNTITPLISVITNIGLDHQKFLGGSLESIANEKAGIIKPNVPVVIGQTQAHSKELFSSVALANNAPIYFADQLIKQVYPTDLKGDYQQLNMRTVLQTVSILSSNEFDISLSDIQMGLMSVVSNTGLLGRWQILQEFPRVIADTAHNFDGLSITLNQLKLEHYSNLHLVIGFVDDKPLDDLIPLFPKKATYYFCKPNIDRGMPCDDLAQKFAKHGCNGNCFFSVSEAYHQALKSANTKDLIFVGGSTFVVSEII